MRDRTSKKTCHGVVTVASHTSRRHRAESPA
jgi:hypothetical protein